jgi:hypothetical protein
MLRCTHLTSLELCDRCAAKLLAPMLCAPAGCLEQLAACERSMRRAASPGSHPVVVVAGVTALMPVPAARERKGGGEGEGRQRLSGHSVWSPRVHRRADRSIPPLCCADAAEMTELSLKMSAISWLLA